MTTTTLAAHIDTSKAHRGQQHRLIALDDRHLFCRDCRQSIDVPVTVQSATQAITAKPRPRGPAPVTGPDTCPNHPGQWHDTCAPCRSEHLAASPNDPPPNLGDPA